MEVITIERNAWEQLLQAMQVLTARVEMLLRKCQDRKLSKWLDNDEVCELLRISPRTLQELRSKHKIGYAQIGRKFYYRPEEVELVSRQQGLYINKVWTDFEYMMEENGNVLTLRDETIIRAIGTMQKATQKAEHALMRYYRRGMFPVGH